MFYTLQKPTTPVWAKTVIIVALGYFIFPIDLIPDLVPGGYTDDFSGLFGALITVSMFIDEEVNNLQQALIGTSSDDLKEIESATESLEKEILKQDDFIQINELSASAIGISTAFRIRKGFKTCIGGCCWDYCCYFYSSRLV